VNIRPLHPRDAGGLLELWNRASEFDALEPGLLHEKAWGDPDFDEELALVAEDFGLLTGFAMGVARETAAGRSGFIKLLAVDPGHQRAGLGGRLLARVEAGLARRGAATVRLGESAPNYLVPGVDARYAAALAFLEKHGYRQIGETENLRVDFASSAYRDTSLPELPRGRGIETRRARPEDRNLVLGFLDRLWPSWQLETLNSLDRDPPALHLALRHGELLAFAAYDGNNAGNGWFGPMGTAPEARGLGLGRALLLRCLRDIEAQGHESAIIPWVGPGEFYRRCAGAVPDRAFYRYEKTVRAAAETQNR